MNRRLEKRHKRQVARARAQVKVSAPDVRTAEQLKALRLANRALVGHGTTQPKPYAAPGVQSDEAS